MGIISFEWTYPKVQGLPFNLTAAEWNAFTAAVNSVRAVKGCPAYPFTPAFTGNDFTASMYNEAVNAVQGIAGYGAWLLPVSAGDAVTAQRMNVLVSELNAII